MPLSVGLAMSLETSDRKSRVQNWHRGYDAGSAYYLRVRESIQLRMSLQHAVRL